MRFTRSATDTEEAARLFREELAALAPLPRNLLGLYVEDEPPAMAAGNLGAMERVMRETAPRIPLLYTLQGPHALEFWLTAGSTVRMTRAYPIRKSTRSDQKSSIKEELTDFLTSCQKRDQSHPLWVVLQAFGDRGRPNIWDPPTPAEIRLMVNLSLARGAKALTYFCFDSSSKGRENLSALAHWPFVPEDGRYAEVGRINALIREHRQLLASFTWVEEIAPARGNVDVQLLSSARGERYAWVTNWDARHTTSAFVRLPGRSGTEELTLDPGAGVIINLQTEERIGF